MISCPVCQAPVGREAPRMAPDSRGQNHPYLVCAACGLWWAHPPPDPETLASHYDADYYGDDQTKFSPLIERWIDGHRRRRAHWVAGLSGAKPGRILDVGCGNGRFLEMMAGLGFEIHGIELPGLAADRAGRVRGLQLHQGALDHWPGPESSLDAVTLWHVLEHTTDPAAILKRCRLLLKEGGVLALEVPNGSSWQARWFGPLWFHLDPPRHLFQFTPKALTQLLRDAGFAEVHWKTLQGEMGLFGFLQSLLNRFVQPRDAFYRSLRLRGQRERIGRRLGLDTLAAVCGVPAAALTLAESLAGQGAGIRAWARKEG
ncbi:MAG: class I SAM-dependent methyltransferase [Verrucomicrobia bacterium]|nr:class I SAM-dependent methyltransferase [Verrucomicrobiota bacterium]MBU1910523.1 class I SAM-dependent methyltransferase [Verrucomicrobiota bacterium]